MTAFAPECMTDQEAAEWLEAAARVRNGARVPCIDCPASYAEESMARGCCNRPVRIGGQPRLSRSVRYLGRGVHYATDEERIAARRQSWREYRQRKRATA